MHGGFDRAISAALVTLWDKMMTVYHFLGSENISVCLRKLVVVTHHKSWN